MIVHDNLGINWKNLNLGRFCKKFQRQGAQILRSEAYFVVRRNDEGCSATQHMDFLQSRHPCFRLIHTKWFFGKIISSDLMGAGPATAADPDEFAMAAFPLELL